MKYIRTNDGIWLNGGEFGCPRVGIVGKKHEYDFGFCFDKKDIIKQADSITMLCDKVILAGLDVVILNAKHTQYRFEGSDKWFDITEVELKRGIYAAVWTDEGIIYAAKMKGVLPNGEIDWELL